MHNTESTIRKAVHMFRDFESTDPRYLEHFPRSKRGRRRPGLGVVGGLFAAALGLTLWLWLGGWL